MRVLLLINERVPPLVFGMGNGSNILLPLNKCVVELQVMTASYNQLMLTHAIKTLRLGIPRCDLSPILKQEVKKNHLNICNLSVLYEMD